MVRHIAATAAVLSLAAAVGCQDDGQHKYGMKPMNETSTATSDAMSSSAVPTPAMPVAIPAGAQQLSQGTYHQIQFTVPSSSGSIYVYDMDTQRVVGVTNAVAGTSSRPMTMADLKNTSQGLNMSDHYQIYFAPTATTAQPIGGGSGM